MFFWIFEDGWKIPSHISLFRLHAWAIKSTTDRHIEKLTAQDLGDWHETFYPKSPEQSSPLAIMMIWVYVIFVFGLLIAMQDYSWKMARRCMFSSCFAFLALEEVVAVVVNAVLEGGSVFCMS